MAQEVTYKQAGVDTQEGARAVDAIRDMVKSTYREEVVGDIGGFGGLFSAAALKGMEDPLLVSGTDGVGTKLALAQRFDKHETVGIDLVAMCANDILACGAQPLFFLDYVAIGKIEAQHVARIISGIAEGCRQAGCALIGGEMAEHPGVMAAGDYDLSGFCVGVVDRPQMIDPAQVKAGDVVLGLASTGIHSNGFSLVRRALSDQKSDEYLLEARDDLDGNSIVDALLMPTRIYVKSILAAIESTVPIHAIAHITGGGITENLNRALPQGLDAVVEWGSWPVLPIIERVVKVASLSCQEALKTFNMGIGMCVICAPDDAEALTKTLELQGEQVYKIGCIATSQEGQQAAGTVRYIGIEQ